MSKTLIDHNDGHSQGRLSAYTRLDKIRSGEAAHPNIRLLNRRRRKGETDASRVKQFLRIERGHLA